jgi:hypothetical protein
MNTQSTDKCPEPNTSVHVTHTKVLMESRCEHLILSVDDYFSVCGVMGVGPKRKTCREIDRYECNAQASLVPENIT